jgi:hypothetical protein
MRFDFRCRLHGGSRNGSQLSRQASEWKQDLALFLAVQQVVVKCGRTTPGNLLHRPCVRAVAMDVADADHLRAGFLADDAAGVPDMTLTMRAMTHVCLYKNERAKRLNPPATLGTGANFTLY